MYRPKRLINMVLLFVIMLSLDEVTIGSSISLWLSILGNPYLQRAIAMAIIWEIFAISCVARNAITLSSFSGGFYRDIWEILLIIACNSC